MENKSLNCKDIKIPKQQKNIVAVLAMKTDGT